MSIVEQFTPQVERFIADLELFASGGYLRDGEDAYWDQPFPPTALPELRQLLLDYLETVAGYQTYDSEIALGSIIALYDQLEAFNEQYQWSVIEPEEEADIQALLVEVWQARRLPEIFLQAIPLLSERDE
ncbi:hypothetical protein [Corynebacterium sp. HS2168-gen11]|uniref:hypothetical protein n=1 Tax=Corynebacterium sp. HS2168-gen11 TaxID=2974027 RepID=UPI00216B6766|nr:hypothetical protein [Corynebacterium sp. HS2168-gen11]MCS4535091.1 hypothetical protein [Corynebacterium sp. HS2168-gen11]